MANKEDYLSMCLSGSWGMDSITNPLGAIAISGIVGNLAFNETTKTTGAALRAHIVHPTHLAEKIKELSHSDPIKATAARQWMIDFHRDTWPIVSDYYISSSDNPNISVGEEKLIKLGMLDL